MSERLDVTAFPAYRARHAAFAGVHRIGDWHVKLYTIDSGGDLRPDPLLDAALERVADLLPDSVAGGRAPSGGGSGGSAARAGGPNGAAGLDVHGEAFAIVHTGEDAVWLLAQWWTNVCLLQRRVVAASLDAPAAFDVPVPETLVACTWEMAILQHERDAWVRHVQSQGPAADLDAYRADVIEAASI